MKEIRLQEKPMKKKHYDTILLLDLNKDSKPMKWSNKGKLIMDVTKCGLSDDGARLLNMLFAYAAAKYGKCSILTIGRDLSKYGYNNEYRDALKEFLTEIEEIKNQFVAIVATTQNIGVGVIRNWAVRNNKLYLASLLDSDKATDDGIYFVSDDIDFTKIYNDTEAIFIEEWRIPYQAETLAVDAINGLIDECSILRTEPGYGYGYGNGLSNEHNLLSIICDIVFVNDIHSFLYNKKVKIKNITEDILIDAYNYAFYKFPNYCYDFYEIYQDQIHFDDIKLNKNEACLEYSIIDKKCKVKIIE